MNQIDKIIKVLTDILKGEEKEVLDYFIKDNKLVAAFERVSDDIREEFWKGETK